MTYTELESTLPTPFHNKELLEQAFIHRSYINENPRSGLVHNERLEFLGDAVLELITTEFLYTQYPHHNEGDLTAYRSALVNAVTLSQVATSLSFNDLLKLSRGEAKDTTRARSSILADAYEAFLGALYLDQGFEAVKGFVHTTLLSRTEEIIEKGLYKDTKSFVQEKAQEEAGFTPTYKVIDEFGPDHDKHFIMAIFFGDTEIARGEGKSKQEAETSAAQAALLAQGWIKE